MSLKMFRIEIKDLVSLALLVFGLTLLSGSANAAAPVEIAAPTASQTLSSTFVVPIKVGDITSNGIFAFQFNIVYDPTVIDPTGANFGCSIDGTLAGNAGMTAICNVTPDGTLRVAAYGAYPMTGSGTVLNIIFRTDSAAVNGSVSPLLFRDAYVFNSSGVVANTTRNGQIRVEVPVPTFEVDLSAPEAAQGVPSSFVVPITVQDISDAGIIAYQFNMSYDPEVIEPTGPNFGCSVEDTLSGEAGMTAMCNVTEEGTLRVAVYGAHAMKGSGTLLNLNFATSRQAQPGTGSRLDFQNVYFFNNSGIVGSALHHGQIKLVPCEEFGECRYKR